MVMKHVAVTRPALVLHAYILRSMYVHTYDSSVLTIYPWLAASFNMALVQFPSTWKMELVYDEQNMALKFVFCRNLLQKHMKSCNTLKAKLFFHN